MLRLRRNCRLRLRCRSYRPCLGSRSLRGRNLRGGSRKARRQFQQNGLGYIPPEILDQPAADIRAHDLALAEHRDIIEYAVFMLQDFRDKREYFLRIGFAADLSDLRTGELLLGMAEQSQNIIVGFDDLAGSVDKYGVAFCQVKSGFGR